MRRALVGLGWLASIGFASTAAGHALALSGRSLPTGMLGGLALGAVSVHLPATFIAFRMRPPGNRWQQWRTILGAAPAWLRRASHVVWAYALVTMGFGLARLPESALGPPTSGFPAQYVTAGLMPFFLSAALIFHWRNRSNLPRARQAWQDATPPEKSG
jgi:hypothetical protein